MCVSAPCFARDPDRRTRRRHLHSIEPTAIRLWLRWTSKLEAGSGKDEHERMPSVAPFSRVLLCWKEYASSAEHSHPSAETSSNVQQGHRGQQTAHGRYELRRGAIAMPTCVEQRRNLVAGIGSLGARSNTSETAL